MTEVVGSDVATACFIGDHTNSTVSISCVSTAAWPAFHLQGPEDYLAEATWGRDWRRPSAQNRADTVFARSSRLGVKEMILR